MKRLIATIALGGLLAGALPAAALTRDEARQSLPPGPNCLTADLDRDGFPEDVSIALTGADTGGVFAFDGRTGRGSSFVHPDYYPFLVAAGDLDRDGQNEVAVGLYGPSLAAADDYVRKLHLFDFDSGTLRPLWFSERAYADFRLFPVGDRWFLIELRQQGDQWLVNRFGWDGFGLWLEECVFVSDLPVRFADSEERRLVIEGGALHRIELYDADGVLAVRLADGGGNR